MLNCKKHFFDIPNDICYLNGASMSPILKSAAAIGHQAIDKRLRPYHYQRSDFFAPVDHLKAKFTQLIHGNDPERIAVIPSASYAFANVANNIDYSKKKTILIAGEQFPSNVYAWHSARDRKGAQIKVVEAPSGHPQGDKTWSQNILDNIDEHTAVVAMAQIHWADGTLFDLKAIRKKTKAFNIPLVIDGTQSIGAYPFDISELEVDALICCAYKWLLGPYSIGLAYYGPYFDEGTPIEHSWMHRKNSEQFENLVNYQEAFKPKATRYSVGETSNFFNVPMLTASIEQLREWQPQNIQAYCKNLLYDYLPIIKSLGCTINEPDQLAYHLFGIRLPGHIDKLELKQSLEEKKVFIAIRGNAVRVAVNVYNDKKDLDQLMDCLQQVIKH